MKRGQHSSSGSRRAAFRGSVTVLGIALGLSLGTWAAVTYDLGPAEALLDSDFYNGLAGQHGAGTAGGPRMAFFPRPSNDGTTVAFWAIDTQNSTDSNQWKSAVFLVQLGDSTTWRRLTADLNGFGVLPIYWTPNSLYIISDRYRIPLATGAFEDYRAMMGGVYLEDVSVTRMATGNWMLTRDGEGMVAYPVLEDGSKDTSRNNGGQGVTVALLSGLRASWPAISRDGTMATWVDWHMNQPGGAPDVCDVFVLRNLQGILGGSVLAPTTWADPNIITVDYGGNVAGVPHFSEDLSIVLFSEDFNNVNRYDNFFPSVLAGDWDIVVRNSDGSGSNYRIATGEEQSGAVPTPGGIRLVFNRILPFPAYVGGYLCNIMVSTLMTSTDVTGDDLGDNDILTTEDQQASDASGTVLEIPSGTTVNFPVGAPRDVQISTPIDPATEPQLPPEVDAIPVIREFGPEGTTFSQPITITISYTDAEVEGLDEPNLHLFRYNAATGVYDIEVTTIVSRDLANNTVSFTVDHFSKYGLGGSVKATPGVGPIGLALLLAAVFVLGVRRAHSWGATQR